MSLPAEYDWRIYQGSVASFKFRKEVGGVPFPTTGLSGRGQIRLAPGSPTKVCDLTVTLENAGIHQWEVKALPAATAAYDFGTQRNNTDPVTCYYDVELYDPSDATDVQAFVKGKAIIYPECTR